jgi:signal transduction histidine kinase
MYRIFQEILTNIARHANATAITIDLQIRDNNLILKIKDNGRGISKQELQNQQSLGLLGMRERAAQWGGTIEITGIPSKGTTVITQIPLPNDMPKDET